VRRFVVSGVSTERNAHSATRATPIPVAGIAGKVQITRRLDATVANVYKATAKGWPARLNAVLAAGRCHRFSKTKN